jgi:hypothetical protein
MSAWHGDVAGRFLAQNRWRDFELSQPLVFHGRTGFEIIVPAGFVTDFASVPRVLWSILPPYGPWTRGAILHDYLWRLLYCGAPHPLAPDSRTAAKIFLEAMRESGVKPVTAWTLYAATRAFPYLKAVLYGLR